mgnify:CR=1 FL=1
MEEKVGFFKRLKNGLSKTRDSFVSGIDSLFTGFSEIDDDFYEELEELLVMGDIGINTTMSIIDGLKERVKEEKIKEASACKQLLIDTIKEQMQIHEDAYEFEHKKSVLLLIGVNGVGKTTSIDSTSKDIAKKVLDYYYTNGLNIVKETDDGHYVIVKERLSYERYKDDLIILETLDENGFPPDNKYYNKKGD